MLYLLLFLSLVVSAPALADGIWLKGQGEQVWVERNAADSPEPDDRHSFGRVAETRRPIVYVDSDRAETAYRSSTDDYGPVVAVRHGPYYGRFDRYRSYRGNRNPRYGYGYGHGYRHDGHRSRHLGRGRYSRHSDRRIHSGSRHGRFRHSVGPRHGSSFRHRGRRRSHH